MGGQTLFDIALMAYGKAEYAYDIAETNDIALSLAPEPGTMLYLPTVEAPDESVTATYAANAIQPATAVDDNQMQALNPEGIGYWTININFQIIG